ncbi:MAG: hypothetical protein ABIQ12_05065 [Opitutaceae bacterium]
MRITLDLDHDVLLAAKEMATRSQRTAGAVISEVFRRGLHAAPPTGKKPGKSVAAGFEVIPADGRVVTAELVQRLRD